MSEYVLLLCPKGSRYSQVSDVDFNALKANPNHNLSQISKETFASWLNAKSLHETRETREVDSSVPSNTLIGSYEGYLHSYSYITANFADKNPFPFTLGQSGKLLYQDGWHFLDSSLNFVDLTPSFFIHKDNFYHCIRNLHMINPDANRAVTINANKINLVETYVFGTLTITFKQTWQISAKFHY